MNAVLSSLRPHRRAVIGAVVVLAVACTIALPKLTAARAAAGLNTISANNPTANEGTASDGTLTFTVSVSGLLLGQATVHYATADGTASSTGEFADYVPTSGDLTFTGSSTSQNVSVTLKKDDLPESNETVLLVLSSATNATLGNSGTGTIRNDDFEFSIVDTSVPEGNSGTSNAAVEVRLSGASDQATSIDVGTTTGGTATAPDDYTAVALHTLSFPAGTVSKTFNVTIKGDTLDEDNETIKTTLANAVGGPRINDGSGVLTITDDDIGAEPSVSIASNMFDEGNSGQTQGAFTVSLSAASGRTVSVRAETSEGSAEAGVDYEDRVSVLTFAPGVTTQSFLVPIDGDTLDELNENFTVTLSNPVSATLSPTGTTATGTILDDDPTPTIAITSSPVTEGATAIFTVTLSAASSRDVTVHVGTVDGTAVAPADYTAVADATVSIPAGMTSATTNVQTAVDTLDEANETFGLHVISAVNATAGPDGTGTINDDDPSPTLSIADVTAVEGASGPTPMVFTVTLSTASGQTVTVHYATVDSTATIANSDYTAKSGDLSFAPTELTKTITVNATGDGTAENDETFKVQLSAPVGASLARGAATGTITNDDGTPPPPPMMITTGAGAGAGSHVRVLDLNGSPQPPEGFFPYPDGPGVRVARGDLDNDGHDEIVVASGPGRPPIIRVFTSNGSLVAETLAYDQGFFGGVFVAVGDVDGNGTNDVITAAGAGGGPHVRTFALAGAVGNRSLVGSNGFFAADPNYTGGLTVASGDVDNDGTDEIIVGHGPHDQPIVAVWNYTPASNAAGQRSVFLAYGAEFLGGVYVAAGDLDGDGRAEIVTGVGPGGGPHVRVFSGNGAGLPGSAYAYPANFAGGVSVAIGDVNGDGVNEIITGAGPGGGPHVRTFDVAMNPGSTSFYAYSANFTGGIFVAAGRS